MDKESVTMDMFLWTVWKYREIEVYYKATYLASYLAWEIITSLLEFASYDCV